MFKKMWIFIFVLFPSLSFARITSLPKVEDGQPLPSNLFIELNKVINPAVVNISTETKPRGRFGQGQLDPMEELFKQFFGFSGGFPQARPQARPGYALGTGFIIREDGLILTNSHVIDKADIINVQLSENDDKKYPAELIGQDPRTDIALIKIKSSKKLPTVKLGSSADLKVGEWVAAFGNPFGHGHSMTKGIVSAKGRDLDDLNLFPFIQTDASINPGNSGGPLVNTRGEVIGVNTAIDARAQGIGFAIPIDEVKSVVKQLESTGSVSRGFLGVEMQTMNKEISRSLGIKRDRGALVVNVLENSAAERAGLRPYDLIVEFNGKKIEDTSDLSKQVGRSSTGKRVRIVVIRENKERTLFAQLGSNQSLKSTPPRLSQRRPEPDTEEPSPLKTSYGLQIENLNKELSERFEVSNVGKHKALITEVRGYSAASMAGLRAGDVIYEINRKAVFNSREAQRLLLKSNSSLMIRVKRGRAFLLVRLEKK